MQTNFPDHWRVMKTAAWVWIIYLIAQASIDLVIYSGRPAAPVLWYHAVVFSPAILFLGLSYSDWLKKQPKVITSLMILIISVFPIMVTSLFDIKLPQAPLSNLEGMVLRQLPVLMIALVLVAWYSRLGVMITYSLAINVFELLVVAFLNRPGDPRLSSFYFIIMIKTVCFIVVGIFINLLITYLRSQQESLRAANQQLTHYNSTLESLTVSRERNRMSRELHDTVVHTLSGLSVQLETMKAYWEVNPGTARSLLDQSLDTTRNGLQETRRALKALRASPLEDLGLVNALQVLVSVAAERGKLQVDVHLPDRDFYLPPDVEQCVYRITQEAVENVVHHANARHLSVKLTAGEGEIHLVVKDDGVGFSAGSGSLSGHFGLVGMQERAQLVGGVLTVQSQPNGGTTIQLMMKGNCQ
jgi:signal transduction histidine kinase